MRRAKVWIVSFFAPIVDFSFFNAESYDASGCVFIRLDGSSVREDLQVAVMSGCKSVALFLLEQYAGVGLRASTLFSSVVHRSFGCHE